MTKPGVGSATAKPGKNPFGRGKTAKGLLEEISLATDPSLLAKVTTGIGARLRRLHDIEDFIDHRPTKLWALEAWRTLETFDSNGWPEKVKAFARNILVSHYRDAIRRLEAE